MQPNSGKTEARGLDGTLAVVLRGGLPEIDALLRELRVRSDLRLIYVRTSVGRLRIVDEVGR
jgi:hypothetical protein